MLDGKKRYIALAIIGFEILSLPAAAQIVHRVAFDVKPQVLAVEIPTGEAGLSRYLVTSNDGFSVDAVDLIGDVQIGVHKSGMIAGQKRFGDAAQLPGLAKACSQSASSLSSPIYTATQKTAAEPGEVVDQAVIFEFRYDPAVTPSFKFNAGTKNTVAPQSCSHAIG